MATSGEPLVQLVCWFLERKERRNDEKLGKMAVPLKRNHYTLRNFYKKKLVRRRGLPRRRRACASSRQIAACSRASDAASTGAGITAGFSAGFGSELFKWF